MRTHSALDTQPPPSTASPLPGPPAPLTLSNTPHLAPCLLLSLPSEVLASEKKSVHLSSGMCVCVGGGRVGVFWGTVCPSVVLFIRHLCVRMITGCVCLVCEGTVDWSTHSCHIPRYKAKQNGTCSFVEKSRWDWSYQAGSWGRAGQGPSRAAHTHHCPHHRWVCAPHTAPSA